MFTNRVGSEVNLFLTALLIIWAALLVGGFIFGKLNDERTRRMPTWTRLSSSFVLVIAAWSWYLITLNYRPGGGFLILVYTGQVIAFGFYIAIGMMCGFFGDVFMARKKVMGGIGAFAFGHIAYITAFVKFAYDTSVFADTSNLLLILVTWIIWLVIGFIAWYITVYRSQPRMMLHWAALAYCLLLSSTAGFATGLALQRAEFIPLAIGAALFLFSDLLITVQLFMHKTFYLIDDVVWLTYGPAQALIVYSVYAALLVVS
jgi:hypothetical protein